MIFHFFNKTIGFSSFPMILEVLSFGTQSAQNYQNHWKIEKHYGFIGKNGKSLENIENASLSYDL